MALSEPGVVIGWPDTDVITSPGTQPAAWATELHSTPTMSAPAAIGATCAGTPGCWLLVVQELVPAAARPLRPPCASSAACWRGSELSLFATCTPRKPGR